MSSLNQPLRMFVFLLVIFVLALEMDCWAQQDQTINWEHGPTTGKLGDIAQIVVPKGYEFSGKEGAKKFLSSPTILQVATSLELSSPKRKRKTGSSPSTFMRLVM